MSLFTDQVARDLGTFLNAGEFSEVHAIALSDGAPRSVAVDIQDDARAPFTAEGVYLSHSTVRIRITDLDAIPVITQRISIDGRQARIVNVTTDLGLAILKLEWFES